VPAPGQGAVAAEPAVFVAGRCGCGFVSWNTGLSDCAAEDGRRVGERGTNRANPVVITDQPAR